jgi:hypothetical protein
VPLKEMNDPDAAKKEQPKRQAKKAPESKSEPSIESPWEIREDGTKVRKGRRLPYEKEIEQFFVEISGAVALADSFSAKAIELKAPELAYGYARLAKDDPRVKAFFEKLLTGSAWSAALFPTVSLAVMIGWHWGVVPPQLGVPMALGTGLLPVTREEEQAMKAQAFKEQSEAEARATHPRGTAPEANGDGNGGATAS